MNFQTPPDICDYMSSFITPDYRNPNPSILEPTPGEGNLVNALVTRGIITAPIDFFDLPDDSRFDCIVSNPPFSPMVLGYKILDKCMTMSDNLIFLMPWLTLINSEKRTKKIFDFGLVSVTHLPRNVFPGSRVQTCILEMKKDYKGQTIFKNYVRIK